MAIPSALVFPPFGGAGSPSTILGVGFFVLYLLNRLHPSSAIGSMRQPLRIAGVLLFCAILTSYVSANLHELGTLEQNGVDRGLIMISGWLGILLLTADGVDRLDRLKTLLGRIVIGATAMAVLGITQFFTGLNAAKYIVIPGLIDQQPYTDISVRGSVNRPSATAIHPIEFGFVLAVVLPIALHRARFAPPGARFRRWLQVALIGTTLPMTVSRSAILGLVIALIVILPTWPRRDRWMALVVLVFSLFVLRTFIHGLIGTLRTLFSSIGSDSSTLSRTAAFSHAAPLISAHPLFGMGFGAFMPQILFYTDDQYLNSLIEIGAVGLVALLAVFITGWCLARRARKASADPEVRHLMQCLAASVAVIIVGFSAFDALYFPMAAGLTFLILGCVGAAWRIVVLQHEGIGWPLSTEAASRRLAFGLPVKAATFAGRERSAVRVRRQPFNGQGNAPGTADPPSETTMRMPRVPDTAPGTADPPSETTMRMPRVPDTAPGTADPPSETTMRMPRVPDTAPGTADPPSETTMRMPRVPDTAPGTADPPSETTMRMPRVPDTAPGTADPPSETTMRMPRVPDTAPGTADPPSETTMRMPRVPDTAPGTADPPSETTMRMPAVTQDPLGFIEQRPRGRPDRRSNHPAINRLGGVLGWIFANAASGRFGTPIIGLVLARWMSPSDLGVFGIIVVALLATQSFVGLGLARAVAQWRGDVTEIVPIAMTISLLSGLVVAGGAYLAAPAFAAAMGAPTAVNVIRILAPSVVISSLTAVPKGTLQRAAPDRRLLVDQADNWVGVALTIGLAANGFGLVSFAFGRIAGSLVAALLCIALAPGSVRFGYKRRALGPLLRVSLPSAESGIVLMAIANADQVVIGRLLNMQQLGLFVLAFCCASWPLTMFSQSVRNMAPAAFAQFRKTTRIKDSVFISAVSLLACLTLPTCILLASLAGPLVHLLYGPTWASAARVLPWLALLITLRVFYGLANDYFAVLAPSRRYFGLRSLTHRTLAFQLAWLVATVPVLIVGAGKDGIVGVAILELEATALMLFVWYVTELRPATVRPRLRAVRLVGALAAAAAVGVIAFGVRQVFSDDYLDVALGGAATLMVTGLLVYRMRTSIAAVRRAAEGVTARHWLMADSVGPVLGSAYERPFYPGLAGTSRSAARLVEPAPKSSANDLGSKIRTGASWSMLNTIVVRVCTFLVTILLARTVFGPRVWGLYAVSQVVLALLLSANELGVSAALIRWDGDVRAIARTVLTISVTFSIVLYGVLYLTASDIARLLGSPAATNVVRLICVCVIIDGFAGIPVALLDREFAQGRRMLVDLANFVVSTGITLWLAFTGKGVFSFAWGSVAGCLVALVVANIAAPYVVLPGWDSSLAPRLLRFGLPLGGASLLTLGVLNVDSAIVGATLGPVMLGLYALAFNISSWPVNSISQAIGRVSFAGFSRVADSSKLADTFYRGLAMLMAVTVPACVLLATLAEPIIDTLYGSRWVPAAHVLTLLAVLGLMRVAYGLVYACMAAAGQRHQLMWVQALWLGALIPALLIGARIGQITGVGVGHVVVAVGVVGPAFLWCLTRIGITVRSIARACMRPFIGGVLMVAVSLAVKHVAGSGVIGLVAASAAAIVVYIPVVFPMRALLRSLVPEPDNEPSGPAYNYSRVESS